MNALVALGLVVAGIIHLLPVAGIAGADVLSRLYGIRPDNADLVIMLRHRALLFGLLGAFLVAAAFRAEWQGLAILAGFLSAAGFVAIAWQTGNYSKALARIVMADIVALVALAVAGAASLLR